MNKSKSSISLVAFMVILFTIGVVPYVTQEAYAIPPAFSTAIADDPDDLDATYSVGDTITLTFLGATNSTAGNTMNNAAVIGNFTFAGTDLATQGSISGVWSSTTVVVLTVDSIAGVTLPPAVATLVSAASTTTALGSGEAFPNDGAITGNAGISGNFGIVAASVPTANNPGDGSGCKGDCEEPTLGVDSAGKRFVDNGFTYNGKSVDVERYFTPYPLITVDVGKQNKAEFKIYENQGPENIKHFSFAFGLRDGEIISESKAMIELDIDHEGTETVTVTDPENTLSNVRVETSHVACNGDVRVDCLGVIIYHTFSAPLDFNIVATDVWDSKRSAWQNYYNHGIEVIGKSLNAPKEYEGIDKRQVYHLTETGKTSAVDEFGNSWILDHGLWVMDYIPNKKIVDGVEQNAINRDNAWFTYYKQGQELLANEKLKQLCPHCSDEEFAEINDIFAYDFPKQIWKMKLSDPEIQSKMLQESVIAGYTLAQIFDASYRN